MKAIGRTQSMIIAALLMVAVLAGGWFGLVKPTKKSVTNLQTQAQAQVSSNSTLQLQLSVLKDLAKKLPQQQAELARIKTKVPDQVQLSALLRQLVATAKDSGVSLTEFTPKAPTPLTGAAGISYVDLVITFNGSYSEVEQYDSALESLSRTLMVKDFNLTSNDAAGSTSSSSSSTAMSSATVGATFNGRVLVRDSSASTSATAQPAATPTTTTKS